MVLLLAACTGRLLPAPASAPLANEHLVVVTADRGDTLADLARTHLHDERQGWRIGGYNGIEAPVPRERLVIPLKPPGLGGLRSDGYQTIPVLVYDRPASPVTFESQMAHLATNGYRTTDPDQLAAFMRLDKMLSPKSVAVALESTAVWVYESAYPILRRHNLRAWILVTGDEIGRPGNLSWTQLAEMEASGMTIGMEVSAVRKPMAQESADQYQQRLDKEIGSAIERFRKRLKTACRVLAHPGGEVPDAFIDYVKRRGFLLAVARQQGSNPFFGDPYRLRRTSVSGDLDVTAFERLLTVFQKAELR
jgi:peptidoglycan/xylan/chitin deacetylase (PgdA/CDA1 family)